MTELQLSVDLRSDGWRLEAYSAGGTWWQIERGHKTALEALSGVLWWVGDWSRSPLVPFGGYTRIGVEEPDPF